MNNEIYDSEPTGFHHMVLTVWNIGWMATLNCATMESPYEYLRRCGFLDPFIILPDWQPVFRLLSESRKQKWDRRGQGLYEDKPFLSTLAGRFHFVHRTVTGNGK